MMAVAHVHGLVVSFLLHLHQSSCLCYAQDSSDTPVLTRVSEPVTHGEGPHWDAAQKALYYVDITGQTLHRYEPSTRTERTLSFDRPIGMVVPIKDSKHKFVVTLGVDIEVLTWDWESGFHDTSRIVSVDQDSPGNRFNDGKADSNGRVWAGTMGLEEPVGVVAMNRAKLYRVDNKPEVACRADAMVSPVSISNGLAWSEDNKILYYIDTPTRRVDAFDFNLETGEISNRRTVFEFGSLPGSPDGMTIDINDKLWIACWGGSMVIQVDPTTGKVMRQVKFPVERVTSAVFGGENLDILYVTTMRFGLNETQLAQQPYAGALWEVSNLKVFGTPSKPAIINCKCNN